MTTLIAYALLQISILTGGSDATTTKKSIAPTSIQADTPTTCGGGTTWRD